MRTPLPRRSLLAALMLVFVSSWAHAQDPDATRAEITASLHEFLTQNSDPAQHLRFWAADLVYTGSTAIVRTKAEIMKSVTAAAQHPADQPAEPSPIYSAEDVLVRPHGSTALLTFRLVAKNPDGSTTTYRNSGTFLHRDGQWRVVTWHATKVPAAE
ncbi:MAG: nuclear transport factor 2 family protein [Candidatus Didemnitutus sp.]|nr:nuclear transport factor 2 family protein [Candidatus Didemnitutus sp.]